MKRPLKPAEVSAKRKKKFYKLKKVKGQVISDKDASGLKLSSSLDHNQEMLEKFIGNNQDIIFRRFSLAEPINRSCLVIYVDGLVDDLTVNPHIFQTLIIELPKITESVTGKLRPNIMGGLAEHLLTVGEVASEHKVDSIITAILSGKTAILLDKETKALIVDTRGWATRGIEEPPAESVIRGPREGFTETLRLNTALIRRKIRSSDLKIESMNIGAKSKTDVAITYLKDVVNPEIVKEVKERLSRIDIDSVLESGYLEELIEDNPLSPFPQIHSTERPDKVVANIMEGRVAILVDHTPFVMIVPSLFLQFFQSAEDYYERSMASTLLRFTRMIAFMISVTLPGFYVAAISFHQEMIPFPLALSIAAGREGVPFPAFIEAILMGLVFEILREAGVRLPKPVGQAVSIVGALVIGDAAVAAGIVSPIMVIIAALTAISSFALPNYSMIIALTAIRFILTVLAAFAGFYGVSFGLLAVFIHLVSLRSFGVPYLSPIAPMDISELKDSAVRVPWWLMFTRPQLIAKRNFMRVKKGIKPGPEGRGGRGSD